MLDSNPIATVDTNVGNFQIELYPSAAPQTVANFLTYVNDGAYNDVIFQGRAPDAGAVTALEAYLAAGGTPEQIAIDLTSSAEFFQIRGFGTNAGFRWTLYGLALHRQFDAAIVSATSGLDFSQSSARLAVVNTLFSSAEYMHDLLSFGAVGGNGLNMQGFLPYGW